MGGGGWFYVPKVGISSSFSVDSPFVDDVVVDTPCGLSDSMFSFYILHFLISYAIQLGLVTGGWLVE